MLIIFVRLGHMTLKAELRAHTRSIKLNVLVTSSAERFADAELYASNPLTAQQSAALPEWLRGMPAKCMRKRAKVRTLQAATTLLHGCVFAVCP